MDIHPFSFVAALGLAYAAGMTLGWYWGKWRVQSIVHDIARMTGSTVDWEAKLSDGSGMATMSMPLPKNHWLYRDHENIPPMPWRMGTVHQDRHIVEKRFEAVARYAIRASTMNGREVDFDPDAMVRNFVVGAVGYYTVDGLSHVDEETQLQPTIDVRNMRNEVQVPVPGSPFHTKGTSGSEGDGPPQFGGGVPVRQEDNSAQRAPAPEEGAGEGQRAGPIRRT